MPHRNMTCLLALFVGVATFACAQPLQTHATQENPGPGNPTPVNPNNPAAGFTWPSPPWTVAGPAVAQGLTINGTIPGPITIGAGNFRRFGMDNLFRGADWTKEFTLEFNYTGGDPEQGVTREVGYHPTRNQPGGTTTVLEETDTGTYYRLRTRIVPQPDWEYVTVRNAGTAQSTLTNIRLTSVCIPEPSTLFALILGTAVAVRRRDD